jgi:ketosteroid isomerase-like protein
VEERVAEGRGAHSVLERFVVSLNEHDLDNLLECFHEDYASLQPAHPSRSFRGRDRVAENWAWVFDSFEDFRADLLDFTIDEETIWTEWRWTGTNPNDRPFEVRGVIILVVDGDAFRCGRLYLEPRDDNE